MPLAGLKTPDGSEFVKHPEFRTVSAFFFGWVFYASLSTLLTSLKLKRIFMRFRTRFIASVTRRPSAFRNSTEKLSVESPMDSPTSSTSIGNNLQRTLIMMLFISFATGSLANFGSLLSFSSDEGLCAFSVAWGTLSTETARLMGLFVLLLTLRHLGMGRVELIVTLIWLMTGLVFVFTEAALATGITIKLSTKPVITPCYRRHFTPVSIVSTSMYLILELFVVVSLWFRIPQYQIYPEQKWARLLDIRILRALSLVMLNLLTAVPSATITNTLAESIPYSVGAIAVLLAFAQEADDWELSNRTRTPSLSPSSASLNSAHLAFGLEESRFSAPTFSAWVPHHPYSARSLSDPALLQTWDDQRSVTRNMTVATARSTRTIDSRTARSIRNAVISQARREKLSVADDGDGSSQRNLPGDEDDAAGIAYTEAVEAAKISGSVKPVRPKLVIVTRSTGPWPDLPAVHTGRDRSSRAGLSLSAVTPGDKMPSSRFSSPSVTTSESRSTITYPSRVLSFSSIPNPTSVDSRTPPSISRSTTAFESPENRELTSGTRISGTVSGPRPLLNTLLGH